MSYEQCFTYDIYHICRDFVTMLLTSSSYKISRVLNPLLKSIITDNTLTLAVTAVDKQPATHSWFDNSLCYIIIYYGFLVDTLATQLIVCDEWYIVFFMYMKNRCIKITGKGKLTDTNGITSPCIICASRHNFLSDFNNVL